MEENTAILDNMEVRKYIPPNETLKPIERELTSAVDAGIATALRKIYLKYEANEDPLANLAFHNTKHTLATVNRTAEILQLMRKEDPSLVSVRDIQLGKLAAAFHDEDQVPAPPELIGNVIKRKRATTVSEENSANDGTVFMREYNESHPGTFTEEDIETVGDAIPATIPGWSTESKTVVQNVDKGSSLIAHALAFADINAAGHEPIDELLNDTHTLFREDNLDITINAFNGHRYTPEELEEIKMRLSSWYDAQIDFVNGRYTEFEKQLALLPNDKVKNTVRTYFPDYNADKFPQKIDALKKRYDELRTFDSIALLGTAGYLVEILPDGAKLHVYR